ncbi:phosphodiesterase [Thalassobaculum sp.]|uniref:phosphodiesterase n=1 Tax=Thalassobaculum sp. TaxID=2022740 RepID=UPI0032EC3BD0
MLLAQITDLHVREPGNPLAGRVDTASFLDRMVARLNALLPRPGAVLITGDLIDNGSEAEYRLLRQRLAGLDMPAYLALGNHDGREAFRACFTDLDYRDAGTAFVQYAVDLDGIRLLVLDTHEPGKPSGALCLERLNWLSERLGEDRTTPTVVAMHHPPVPVGMPRMDPSRLLAGAERFKELIACAPNVERILAGHLHRPVTVRFAGTVLDVMPGAAHQIHLDLLGEGPLSFAFEPPMLQLHAMVPGAGLVSHKVYAEPSDGPYPFRGG